MSKIQVLYYQVMEERFHPLTGQLPVFTEKVSIVEIPDGAEGVCTARCAEKGCNHLLLLHRNEEITTPRSCKVFGCRCLNYKVAEEKEK